MPVEGGISGEELITLNWSIQNFSYNVCTMGDAIQSPNYEFKNLGQARWQLKLFPKGNDMQDFMACHVVLDLDDETAECDTYDITLSVRVGDRDMFEKQYRHTFRRYGNFMCDSFIGMDEIKRYLLPNNVFSIRCKLYPVCDESERSDHEDFKILSREMTNLLECHALHDLTLKTDDIEFKVHKSILAARWPDILQEFGIEVGLDGAHIVVHVQDIDSDTLGNLIEYVYSGTLDGLNVSKEVFKAAVRYDFRTLRKNLAVFPKEYFGITEFKIERKTVIWHLDDVRSWDRTPLSFIRVLPMMELYPREIIITFSIAKTPDGDEAIDIAFHFSRFRVRIPIYLECKMSLSVQNGETQAFRAADHLFQVAGKWHFPLFIKKSDIIDKTRSLISMELAMCAGDASNMIVKTETEFFTDFTPIEDLRKLSTDLSKMYPENHEFPPDSKLVCKGGEMINVHRAILWTRWPELRPTLEEKADEAELFVELDIDEVLLHRVIPYIYSGNSEEISNVAIAQDILEAAKNIPLPKSLEQKCIKIIETEVV